MYYTEYEIIIQLRNVEMIARKIEFLNYRLCKVCDNNAMNSTIKLIMQFVLKN